MKKLAFCSILALSGTLLAEESAAQNDSAPISAESAAASKAEMTVKIKAKARLDEAFADFARELGISYGDATPDGRFYAKGSCQVDADVTSPRFLQSRAMAYERAFVAAVSQFMLDFYGRQTAEKVNAYYMDDSSEADKSPVMSAKGVAAKVELLTEAKLDKALREEGVDPEKYAQASVVEKRKLFQDALVTKTSTQALHASSGCIPVKTIEAWGDDGRYYIGVVVRYDRTSKTLANCFRYKTRPAVSKASGLTIAEAVPAREEMYANFGVRLYFDETGTPALLSFGQFGSSYTGKNERMAERHEEMALKQARALADNNLTMFINSFMDVAETSEVGEDISESRIFMDDGNVTPEECAEIVNRFRKTVKQHGVDTMKGRSTVFEEIVPHPNGHRIAMVVRRWSFSTVDAVTALDTLPTPKPQNPQGPAVKPLPGGVTPGRTYDF